MRRLLLNGRIFWREVRLSEQEHSDEFTMATDKGVFVRRTSGRLLDDIWAGCPAPDQLTEFSAHLWEANAYLGTASIVNDTTRVRVGSASLKFTTDSGYDTGILTPPSRNASWNLSNTGGMAFWIYAENPNIGFQNNSP